MPEQPNGSTAQAERDAEQDEEIKSLRRRERALFWIAAFGAFIAAVSAGVSTLQWHVMRQQLQDSRDGAASAHKETERALTAAESQAASMRSALLLDQRAWLTVKDTSTKVLIANETPAATLGVVNTGRTPAVDVIFAGAIFYSADGKFRMTDAPAMELMDASYGHPGGAVIGSGGTQQFPVVALRPVTGNYIDAIGRGPAKLYIVGYIRYKDVFRRAHATQFCFHSAPLQLIERKPYYINEPPEAQLGAWQAVSCEDVNASYAN